MMAFVSDELIQLGLTKASDTVTVDIGRGVLSRVAQTILGGLKTQGRSLMVIADQNTWDVAGAAVDASLREARALMAEPMVFPGSPCLAASLENSARVRAQLAASDAVAVVVGSGTLNDLVKFASANLGRPYAVVGTAASMDGYSGFGAPLESHGVKATRPCAAPAVVVLDLDVTAAAPPQMVASGYGDLAAKFPGGADWLVADAAEVEPIDDMAWRLVQTGVRDALARPAELAAGQPDAFEGLVQGLVLSGLAMQVYAGTRPASGAEHYFSHLWEIEHLGADAEPPLSHGFKVAIGTLAMSAFYERFLARDLAALDVDAAVAVWPSWEAIEADIRGRFTGALADHAVNETKVKYVDEAGLAARLRRLAGGWGQLRPRLEAQLLPARTLQAMLADAGAPSRPEDIGLTAEDVRAMFPKAMYYRSRYTVLDVARECGWFDELVDETFAPGGLWS